MVLDRSNPAESLNLDFFREDDRQVSESVIDGYSIAVGTLLQGKRSATANGSWLKDILDETEKR